MPAAYSLDLRERVVATVGGGVSRRGAAGVFKVSVSTAWPRRYAPAFPPANPSVDIRDPGMPPFTTVQGWARTNDCGFTALYNCARELQAQTFADELIDIADDGSNDWVRRENQRGRVSYVVDKEHIARSRLRFEARQWVISKILPKTFGDKLQLKHNSAVASPVLIAAMDPIEASKVYQRVMTQTMTVVGTTRGRIRSPHFSTVAADVSPRSDTSTARPEARVTRTRRTPSSARNARAFPARSMPNSRNNPADNRTAVKPDTAVWWWINSNTANALPGRRAAVASCSSGTGPRRNRPPLR